MDNGIPLVNPSDLRGGKILTESAVKVPENVAIRMVAYRAKVGDLILARRGELGRYGLVTSAEDGVLCGTGSLLVRVSSVLVARFLGYFLQTREALDWLSLHSVGSTMENLSEAILARLPIPDIPTAQQERIANFLDDKTARIDALIAEKEQLVERLKEYQYSYSSNLMTRGLDFQAELVESSFPEIGNIPKSWTVKRLKFLGEVRSGVAKGKDLGERDTVTLPYLRVANVQDGYVDLTEVYDIEVAASEAPRYFLHKNDVLMNEGGDNDKLGRGAVWRGQIEPCIHQNHVFAVRLEDPGLAEWVSCFTSTAAARAYFYLRSKQSTNLASINQSNVRELPIPMPPANERKALLAELQRSSMATSMLIEHAVEHIARLREYRSSLISAAVTSQLELQQ
ncbi:MAG: restriction endonuclease subunit S [Polaromonas sp.]|uniref:restriction endonuclease subunit S n=1 Tax=Polaromonas sp. TaxID=1869339 RepID=UPI002487F2EB|nr:restriction endonuclease subunit S [Polaromonas sp.]MDI1270495.1 restriction endonuclease subunit S [Polaromonas sp.]